MIDQKNQLREVAQCQKYSKTAAEVEKSDNFLEKYPSWEISTICAYTHMRTEDTKKNWHFLHYLSSPKSNIYFVHRNKDDRAIHIHYN